MTTPNAKLLTIGIKFLGNRFYLYPRPCDRRFKRATLREGFYFLCFHVWGEFYITNDAGSFYTHD